MTIPSNLPSFEKAHILVIGDVMLDSYWSGSTERVSPEAPVPIVKMQKRDTRPGGAANVALNLAMIGCQVNLIGVVGEDEEARDLQSQLQHRGIQCHFEVMKSGRTISKLRIISRNQQMLRLDFESVRVEYDEEQLLKKYSALLTATDVVVLSDYDKGTLFHAPKLIQLAKERGIPVFVDPKGNDFHRYRDATLMTPNLMEFEAVVGGCHNDEETIVSRAKALIAQQNLQALLVTRGQDGMTFVFSDDRKPLHLKAHAREVFDVTGAGDTVIALISAATAVGVSDERSAYLANVAAGLVVKKVGTAFVTMTELREEIRRELGMTRGVLSKKELFSIVADAKAKGEKVVMTNGCFDILHPGHIQYLHQARALGDHLLVAVNSDASVSRLKGATRPIHPLAIRMEMLAALRSVDWVIDFSEDTPERLIAAILPNILVKGGDYQVDAVVGHELVREAGGEVIILPFREGYSTTRLIEELQEH